MKKYKTEKYSIKIKEVESPRATDKSVWVMEPFFSLRTVDKLVERKHPRDSEYAQYHDTWDAAHAYLLRRAEGKLENARYRLQEAQSEHGNVVGMKP